MSTWAAGRSAAGTLLQASSTALNDQERLSCRLNPLRGSWCRLVRSQLMRYPAALSLPAITERNHLCQNFSSCLITPSLCSFSTDKMVSSNLTASSSATELVLDGAERVKEFLLYNPPGTHQLARPLTVLQSCAAWWAIFLLLQWTGLGKPRSLKRKDYVEWDARVISSLHALVLVAASAICFYDSRTYTREQYVTGYTFLPDLGCRIFLGYLLYDVTCIMANYSKIGEFEALLHHGLFIAVSIYVLQHSIMAFPFVWLALGELSTLPLNLRWHLAVLGKKSTNAYLVNGLVLLGTFFVGRVVANGWGIVHLWGLRDIWLAPDQPKLTPAVFGLFLMGYCLNLYWFVLIAKGAYRAISRKPVKKVE